MLGIHLRAMRYSFARSRIRREMKIDPKLKNYSQAQDIQLQINELRTKFEQQQFLLKPEQASEETLSHKKLPTRFTDIIHEEKFSKSSKNRLGEKFFIDQKKFNKDIKKAYKDRMQPKYIKGQTPDQFKYLDAGQSHLNTLHEQIQFQRKFQQKLFRVKETKRLLAEKENDLNNYLEDRSDREYLQYEDAKTRLKNNRINNMMNFSRNNEQLQLLIESGMMNNPQNLKMLIDDLNEVEQDEKLQVPQQLPSSKEEVPRIEQGQEKSVEMKHKINGKQSGLIEISTDKDRRMSEIGPEELQDLQKIEKFKENYKEMHSADRKHCRQDLDLLKQIKTYEDKLFLSRYEAINFRFKGAVKFNFFKENELVTYLKNQQIPPNDLLLIYDQNKNSLNKFNLPIITPRVLSNIYSKSSLYKFPQTDQNNRINMLNDKLFQKVEKETFKNLDKLGDDDFCSAVWSYAKNHEEQMGVLKPGVSDKINGVVLEEFRERMYQLDEGNLGLVLRGMAKMPIMKNQEKNWKQIVQFLDKKLKIVEDMYTMQSIFQFLIALTPSTEIITTISNHIDRFVQYEWTQLYTLNTFTYSSGLLLRHTNPNSIQNIQKIKKILITQKTSLQKLLTIASINFIPQFLTIIRETRSILEMKEVLNLCKKLTSENINQQKQIISQQNVVGLIWNHALIDIAEHNLQKVSKFAILQTAQAIETNLVRKLTSKILLPHQVLPFNSVLYFVYHDIAKLAQSEMHVLTINHLGKIIEGLSIVSYRNEQLYDQLVQKTIHLIDAVDLHDKPIKQEYSPIRPRKDNIIQLFALCSIISSYGFQRRVNGLYLDCVERLLDQEQIVHGRLSLIPANLILRIITILLSFKDKQILERIPNLEWICAKMLEKYVMPFENLLIKEEHFSLMYVLIELQEQFETSSIQQIFYKLSNTPANKSDPYIKFITCLWEQFRSPEKTLKTLETAEKNVNNQIEKDMLKKQQEVGCPHPYTVVMKKIYDMKVKEVGQEKVVKKNWRIQIPEDRQVIFFATYDQLITINKENGSNKVMLYGIWRLYERLYEKLGWNMKLVCTFLEG